MPAVARKVEENKLSPSHSLAAKTLFAAMLALKDSGGSLASGAVLEEVAKRVNLDEWAKERYQKSGYVRWQSILHFFSIDACKAGYLTKKKGVWYLTLEGERALELGEIPLFESARAGFKAWRAANPRQGETGAEDLDEAEAAQTDRATAEVAEAQALEGIKEHIWGKNPYEFQDLCAALLRAMGYYTPIVAPRGPDGGVDIHAYRDPLGSAPPRIKVQVKHRKEDPVDVKEVRALLGLLSKEGDTGLFISSGGYTKPAEDLARSSSAHVELVDINRFISLWIEFFPKMSEEDQSLMPVVPVFYIQQG